MYSTKFICYIIIIIITPLTPNLGFIYTIIYRRDQIYETKNVYYPNQ
jgi:hypothetical protein